MGPLNGIKILEFAGIGPGPFCGMLLADLGAEVIKISRPESKGNGSGLLILITSAPRSASSMPQNGPGPIPANSKILIPFSGPIQLSYSKALILSNKIGNKVNDTKNAKNIASAVKIPK